MESHVKILEQAIELLGQLSPSHLTEVNRPMFSASIGDHLRHVSDHYDALLRCIEQNDGTVDYNKRCRQSLVSTSLEVATQTFIQLRTALQQLGQQIECFALPVEVICEIDIYSEYSERVMSTIGRELLFVSSHAIHHYAIISSMQQAKQRPVPAYFGYAPATITALREASAS